MAAGQGGVASGEHGARRQDRQPLLGGAAITGQCCIPIVSRTLDGSECVRVEPDGAWREIADTGDAAGVLPWRSSAREVGQHESGLQRVDRDSWGGDSGGVATLLLVGCHGVGPFCYGTGGAAGECVDPAMGDKGNHGILYAYQVWAYDLNDLAGVKAGHKKPWDVRPDDVWTFTRH